MNIIYRIITRSSGYLVKSAVFVVGPRPCVEFSNNDGCPHRSHTDIKQQCAPGGCKTAICHSAVRDSYNNDLQLKIPCILIRNDTQTD